MQCQTHSGVKAVLQTRPLQQADERCPFHCCPGHHDWESHSGPLRYFRWTDIAGSIMLWDRIVESLRGVLMGGRLQFECVVPNIEVSRPFKCLN